MEAFLLFFVLILLFVIISNLNSKFKATQETINKVLQKVEQLQKQLQTFEGKETVSTKEDIVFTKTEVSAKVVEPELPKAVVEVKEPIPIPKFEKPKEPVSVSFQKPEIIVKAPIPKKSWSESFKENNPDLEKFIGENLINKIGILILVLGISFFVKYAIDKDWINETARVGIGILAGSIVMGIAHKLRANFTAFSSVLVAGAVSIFYFTIAIAFHEYQLFSQTVAFSIMVVITAFSSLVSVSYNRMELAILSLIGGFAVPFMVSTGQGNYVVLFSYIVILNTGILSIAYFKKWNVLNLLSFIFTIILFGGWYVVELFDNKLPHRGAFVFATIFYLLFSIITVIHNLRRKGTFGVLEYMIMIGNTFFYFSVGMGILHNWGIDFKGLFTLAIAVFNLIYAVFLYKRFGFDKNAIYLLLGLTLTFVTLTIPIQFKGNYITLFWAIEAVLLFWLSKQSKINSFKLGAIIVQILMIFSLVIDWINKYSYFETELAIVLNPIFITGIVALTSLIATYLILKKETEPQKVWFLSFNPNQYTTGILLVATLVAYFVGMLETSFQANQLLKIRYSSLSYSILYHFIFSAVVIYFALQPKKHDFRTLAILLATINIGLYILYFFNLPTEEFLTSLNLGLNEKSSFYIHYLLVFCLVYFFYAIIKCHSEVKALAFYKSNFALWTCAFAIIFILSYEMMIHSLYVTPNVISTKELAQKFPENNTIINWEKAYFIDSKVDEVKRQIIKIGFPILWGVLSFAFLIVGIKKQWKQLRIISLTLLGMTIAKLFVYDIKNVSETGKIVAFILLGILILIISFVYQKIKKLVVDETPKNDSDEN
ncbi:DUF2339 domain-containing protein [Flavobacterium sp.]|jgi:hypothetical protein|uniref:DUF2339 domain-containing protein n=1 Tax=Flavobacterium sp. TaxID=239 RepID=UPI0037BF0139